tara:strand:- start:753 stop:977 length:225 start_codon:yes stop_codon:yes gene_type:complete
MSWIIRVPVTITRTWSTYIELDADDEEFDKFITDGIINERSLQELEDAYYAQYGDEEDLMDETLVFDVEDAYEH